MIFQMKGFMSNYSCCGEYLAEPEFCAIKCSLLLLYSIHFTPLTYGIRCSLSHLLYPHVLPVQTPRHEGRFNPCALRLLKNAVNAAYSLHCQVVPVLLFRQVTRATPEFILGWGKGQNN